MALRLRTCGRNAINLLVHHAVQEADDGEASRNAYSGAGAEGKQNPGGCRET